MMLSVHHDKAVRELGTSTCSERLSISFPAAHGILELPLSTSR